MHDLRFRTPIFKMLVAPPEVVAYWISYFVTRTEAERGVDPYFFVMIEVGGGGGGPEVMCNALNHC